MSQYVVGSWASNPVNVIGDTWQPHPWMNVTGWGSRSDAGMRVSPSSIYRHTPLWHGLLLLGGDSGSLHIQQKRIEGGEVVDVTDSTAYSIASVRTNALMCPCNFWEMMVPRAISWGNAICEVPRMRNGAPLPVDMGGGLIPLPPEHTKPWFDKDNKLWIRTQVMEDRSKPIEKFLDPEDTFHLPSMTTDGFWGLSLAAVAKNRIANGLGFEKQSNKFMENGMTPDWLFVYPVQLDEEIRKDIDDYFDAKNAGLNNAGKRMVLDNDVKATRMGMDNEASQFIELIQQDVQFAASLLGIPAIMLNAMEKMTFSNAEESERWYINRTLRRWLNKIEQELKAKLLTESEQQNNFFKYDLDPLLMGRFEDRMDGYSKAIASRILSPNEIRQKEGFNPYEGGDTYENPNTIAGGNPNITGDQNPEGLRQAELMAALNREDQRLTQVMREAEDVNRQLNEYYHGELLRELFDIVPNHAADYCQARFKLWVKFAHLVPNQRTLGEMVKAQKQTTSDRVAGLLQEEYLCLAASA